jgi:hypothetical protein
MARTQYKVNEAVKGAFDGPVLVPPTIRMLLAGHDLSVHMASIGVYKAWILD